MKNFAAIITVIFFIFLTNSPCFANAKTEAMYKKAINLVDEKQDYNSAIEELKKAICIDSNDKRLLYTIVKFYGKRAEKYANIEEWGKALNDYRSALFYFCTFDAIKDKNNKEYNKTASVLENGLMLCYKKLKFRPSAKKRLEMGVILEMGQEYAAAGLEYQLAALGSKKYAPECMVRLYYIYDIVGYKPEDGNK